MKAKNNIFNIRATGTKWQGQTGQKKGFCEFIDQEHCIRAWLVLMRTYRRKHGCNTIRTIVTRFAPPTENDTLLYIRQMVRWTSIGADAVLTGSFDYCFLGAAMALKETGTRIFTNDVYNVMNKYQIFPWE